jgi:hypothetical protein
MNQGARWFANARMTQAAAQAVVCDEVGGLKGFKMTEVRVSLRDIIRRSVMGTSKLWPIDLKYPAEGSLEDRFKAGDKQILLWAIDDYAQRGQPIPDWAARALNEVIYRAAQGELDSWDDAFGKIFASMQKRRAQTLARMLDVYYRVRELHAEGHAIDNDLFECVGKELKLTASGKTSVQELYLRVKAEIEPQTK